ncbi:MAG: long-chain fatty acid--CoA ligase [Alphaproteobacteria bacterium]
MSDTSHLIPPQDAVTLDGLLRRRAERTPDLPAYREFDAARSDWVEWRWGEVADEAARWRAAFAAEDLVPGDRVAVLAPNGRNWVLFDQAALGAGLVTVPLYVEDRGENIRYILKDSGAKLLYLDDESRWADIGGNKDGAARDELAGLVRVVTKGGVSQRADPRLTSLDRWLPDKGTDHIRAREPDDLATIVYTSGTTGAPKGVMLSHRNILENAWAGLQSISIYPDDVLISFLPLSHTFERTVGYYTPIMSGSLVAYTRSIPDLAEDLTIIRPTAMISVPRIFERVHERIMAQLDEGPGFRKWLFNRAVEIGYSRFERRQGRAGWRPGHLLWPLLDRLVAAKIRARLGGRLRFAVSGGAALPPFVSRVFLGLGVNVLQGYGLTEAGPIVSVNKLSRNIPESVGPPLEGVEVRLGENDELEVSGPNVMLGYWQRADATADMMTGDGWLRTGDRVRIHDGYIYITGRMKEIIVLDNGEKVPPGDMEHAIATDPLIDQVLVLGEGRPHLAALVVLNGEQWQRVAEREGLPVDPGDGRDERVERFLLGRLDAALHAFPGYARIYRAAIAQEPWTVENGLMTPTLKIRRPKVLEHYGEQIEAMYQSRLARKE